MLRPVSPTQAPAHPALSVGPVMRLEPRRRTLPLDWPGIPLTGLGSSGLAWDPSGLAWDPSDWPGIPLDWPGIPLTGLDPLLPFLDCLGSLDWSWIQLRLLGSLIGLLYSHNHRLADHSLD
ncbi:hypothetical protein WMY93_031843 [Mugilogobius chulae]|uniref:Uncharacterized protein n=1 Tax=Mugilogobius chulae TaxID=88201 RepID=A0AAW0MLW8_9GOBI